MNRITSWILWKGEKYGSYVISKFLWPPTTASALVINENKILAVKQKNYYMLPGGINKAGETLEETAKRETLEETGVKITIKKEIETNHRKHSGMEKVYLGKPENDSELKGSWEGKPMYIDLEKARKAQWRWNRNIEQLLEKIDK